MSKRDLLYQTVFGSDENDGKLLLEAGDQLLSKFVYDVACEEPQNHTKSGATSDENVETTMENFERLIDLFENAVKAQKLFLDTFEGCAPLFKKLLEQLKEISESVENIKCGSKIILIISGLVGTLAAIALCLTCPPVSTPVAGAALAAAGVVMAGASLTENYLKQRKLTEANVLIRQIESELENMAHWFEYPEELKKAFGTLINYNTLIEINDDLKKFFSETLSQVKLTAAEFKKQFKEKLQDYMKEMMKDSKISGLDDEIRPIIKTFLVVCLIKGQHQFVLDSLRVTLETIFGVFGLANGGQLICELLAGIEGVAGDLMANLPKLFVPVALVINIFVVILSAKELTQTSKLAQQINEAVKQFEASFLLLEGVYKRLKKFESISETDVIQWTAVIVHSVPHDAQRVHIKKAIKPYLHKEAHGCIKLEKLPTCGHNWLVSIPQSHSHQLLEQDFIEIKKQRCFLTK